METSKSRWSHKKVRSPTWKVFYEKSGCFAKLLWWAGIAFGIPCTGLDPYILSMAVNHCPSPPVFVEAVSRFVAKIPPIIGASRKLETCKKPQVSAQLGYQRKSAKCPKGFALRSFAEYTFRRMRKKLGYVLLSLSLRSERKSDREKALD